jgi:hypothetical protein
MQETAIGWEPMYEGRLPWFTKVFVVYLALVLFASVFRAIRLMRHLRGLRKVEQETPSPPTSRFQLLWEICYAKAASIKNLSVLTFLLTLLVFAWSTTRILLGVTMEKVTAAGFLAGAIAVLLGYPRLRRALRFRHLLRSRFGAPQDEIRPRKERKPDSSHGTTSAEQNLIGVTSPYHQQRRPIRPGSLLVL